MTNIIFHELEHYDKAYNGYLVNLRHFAIYHVLDL